MRSILLLALVAILLPAFATAQTPVNPVQGAFEKTYVIAGRVVDKDGFPVTNTTVTVTLAEDGVKGAPVRGLTNCNGDFISYYTLDDIQATGRITVVVDAHGLTENLTQTAPLDPFYRRSDVHFQLPVAWNQACADAQQFPTEGRVSITGRIVSRVDPPVHVGSLAYDSKAYGPNYGGLVLRYFTPDGKEYCPPGSTPNTCERLDVDERGDFKYTFTFPSAINASGVMRLVIANHTFNVTVDPTLRVAQAHLELTGQGSPVYVTNKSPGIGVAPLVVALVALAVCRRFLPSRRG